MIILKVRVTAAAAVRLVTVGTTVLMISMITAVHTKEVKRSKCYWMMTFVVSRRGIGTRHG